MKILETEIGFDFCEVDNVARYEKALEVYMEKLKGVRDFKGKESEGFSKLCDIVYEFFDNLVGKGTSGNIFGVKKNYAECLEAMGQVIKAKEGSVQVVTDMINKYIPKGA